jgi:hypothetical protein
MIYVIHHSIEEATRFVIRAHLNHSVRAVTAVDQMPVRFEEDDEVFVLKGSDADLARQARVANDKSWPKPHLYKIEMEVIRDHVGAQA